jgi:hypothetical protein
MPKVTITRTGKLEKPMGLGEGRIVEGTIYADWGSARTFKAGGGSPSTSPGSAGFGLRTITNLIVTPGTPLDIEASARVINPGTFANTARVIAYLKQKGKVTVPFGGSYKTYPVAFTGSPDLALAPGSPTTGILAIYAGSVRWPYIQRQRLGSFRHIATPTFNNTGYVAVGPGSFPVNYIAIGD